MVSDIWCQIFWIVGGNAAPHFSCSPMVSNPGAKILGQNIPAIEWEIPSRLGKVPQTMPDTTRRSARRRVGFVKTYAASHRTAAYGMDVAGIFE
jgi:hypothetical protein